MGPEVKAARHCFRDRTCLLVRSSSVPRRSPPVLVAAVLIGGQYLVFFRTPLGRQLRAVAQDREMALAIGIPAFRLIAMTSAWARRSGRRGRRAVQPVLRLATGGVSLRSTVISRWWSEAGQHLRRVAGASSLRCFRSCLGLRAYTVATAASTWRCSSSCSGAPRIVRCAYQRRCEPANARTSFSLALAAHDGAGYAHRTILAAAERMTSSAT